MYDTFDNTYQVRHGLGLTDIRLLSNSAFEYGASLMLFLVKLIVLLLLDNLIGHHRN